jgi:hypothetical protein
MSMNAADISARRRGRIVGHGQYLCRCPLPTHGRRRGDLNPSLSLADGDDGRLLATCHAGCDTRQIFDWMQRQGWDINIGPKFVDRPATRSAPSSAARSGPGSSAQPIATYDYTDEAGNLLFQVARFVPKAFRQRRPDGQGGWIWNIDGVRRVPYRLPDLLEAEASGQDHSDRGRRKRCRSTVGDRCPRHD